MHNCCCETVRLNSNTGRKISKMNPLYRRFLCTCALIIGCVGIKMAVHAETAPLSIYLKMTQQHIAYTGPGTEYDPMGYVEKDTIAIVYAMTDNYWYQIYYKGQIGYISHDNVTLYTGGDGSIAGTKLTFPQGQPIIMDALGDSITAGEKLLSQSQTYAALLGEKIGAAAVYNYGFGGSAVAGIHPDRFLDRYLYMNPNANLITVFGGTNDYGFDTALGSMGDRTGETYYGGLNQLMSGLKQMYPNAEIVFITPLKRENGLKKNKYGNTLDQYAQAVINMAAFYDYRVINVYSPESLNFAGQKSVYMKDGIHPTAKAHEILAEYIYQSIFS